ncbi:uncharacterized protein LOC105213539 [Zeugodacus cucurbitae]|uniref:uncharacterized protein LOC105213539 n=1 Tax=Zeugodacus cucurbitae TaxID=28588 RepID=UPI00059691F5|nr:uncharacterized protein LOC105213539 [Zeugodacus cucurbitae]
MSRRQRVVVVVDEDVRGGDPEEFRNILDLSMSIPSPALKGFKSAIYAKWATHAHTQPLRFDCVGTTRNAFVRAEYAMLMDELFLNRSSCCLLQFFPLRECQISFLCNLLVSEVDKRMMVLQAKLLRIKVEYFDLRKYDVINFLGSSHPRSTTKNQRNSRPHNLFGNTLDLLRWLQTRYLQLFGKGQGTENLDLEFTFSDSQTRVHTVRLSIMHVFLCHMDSDTKTCLRNCFENIRSAKRGRKSIMLTDCLREILGPKANWFTWFVFHVPIAKGRGIIIDDQLNLASSAYAGINAKESSDVRAPDDFDLSSLLSFLNVSNDSQLTVNSQLGASVLSMAQNTPTFIAANSSRSISNRLVNKHNQTYNLNTWYTKMDQLVPAVLKHIHSLYEYKYRENIQKICSELKNMLSFSSLRPANSICCMSRKGERSESLDKLEKNYHMIIREFIRLAKEIENSPDSAILRVYLDAKKKEIKDYATNCKLRHLETCQNCLIETIKGERNMLTKTGTNLEFIRYPAFKTTISGNA